MDIGQPGLGESTLTKIGQDTPNLAKINFVLESVNLFVLENVNGHCLICLLATLWSCHATHWD